MKLQKVRAIAKEKGIRAGNLEKGDLIRASQRREGNFQCYGSATAGECDQVNCLWREDCLAGR
ncbi:MAG: SAP domain-containing protein [Nitrospiraceae bacterium]|nr:SAP domain-containing protein [Nitrospiraceae bacterium]